MTEKQPYPEKCYLPFIFYPTAMWPNTYGTDFVEKELMQYLLKPCGDYVIYISIPFCRVRCKGCPYFVDFLTRRDPKNKESLYLDALLKDIKKWSEYPRWKNGRLKAVYIGGGTGSILTTVNLKRLVNAICSSFPVEKDTEITLEGNAHDYDDEKIQYVAQSPINRISLGVQSFNKEVLKVVGSPHAAEESEAVIKAFQAAGVKNIQIDMMYNMPRHTMEVWKEDLQKLKTLGIKHLTVYLYRIHDGTPQDKFIKEGKEAPVADRESPMVKKMFTEFRDMVMKEMGFELYMHNHFCEPGYRNVYNDYNLEHVADTLGIGAGAYSLIGDYRVGTSKNVSDYVDHVNNGHHMISTISEKMDLRNHKERYMMFTLQYFRAHFSRYRNRFGSEMMDDFGDIIRRIEKKGLILIKEDQIEMTALGREWFLNVVLEFVNPKFWGNRESVEQPNWSMNIVLVDLIAGNRERWLGKQEKELSAI
jgi:oxygen-independent coproporphyrinogen III oxidase